MGASQVAGVSRPVLSRRRLNSVVSVFAGVIIMVALALGLSACSISRLPQELVTGLSQRAPASAAAPAQITATPLPAFIDGLPVIARDRLPPEARQTLALIERGGPFPYRQDGSIFQNRERLLPRRPAGYYRAYTVVTPGSPDRGARRIVVGAGGEVYYTADHYRSFARVLP